MTKASSKSRSKSSATTKTTARPRKNASAASSPPRGTARTRKSANLANSAAIPPKRSAAPAATKPRLLAGGNPQIAKADGDAPVQAYIEAMPGVKREIGRRLDALIVQAVPNVTKAVRWNTPFYGLAGSGWFLGFHCITRYIKIAFFNGAALDPLPPVASKQKDVRYLHVLDDGRFDEAQFVAWVSQASRLPGMKISKS